MGVARGKQGIAFGREQFVRRAISSGAFHENERTIIDHEMFLEEIRGGFEFLREQSPQPLTADFAAGAIKTDDASFGMFQIGLADFGGDAEPIAHGRDFTEGHSGLCHAERPGIHPKKKHALAGISVLAEVGFVRGPGVIQWIVDVRNRGSETQAVNGIAKAFGGLNERGTHGDYSVSKARLPPLVVARAMQLAKGALKILNLTFVIDFLPLGEFQSFEHFLHFLE